MDHVNDYKPPKEHDDMDEVTRKLQTDGCAPVPQLPVEHIKREAPSSDTVVGGVRLPQRLPIGSNTIPSAEPIKSRRDKRTGSDNDDNDSNERKSKKVWIEFPL